MDSPKPSTRQTTKRCCVGRPITALRTLLYGYVRSKKPQAVLSVFVKPNARSGIILLWDRRSNLKVMRIQMHGYAAVFHEKAYMIEVSEKQDAAVALKAAAGKIRNKFDPHFCELIEQWAENCLTH